MEDFLVDTAERNPASRQLPGPDLILGAVAKIALDLLSTTAIDASMPRLLGILGEATGSDRVIVLESQKAPDGTLLVNTRFTWNADGLLNSIQPGRLGEHFGMPALLGTFFRNLPRGQVFTAFPRTLSGEVGLFFRSLGIQSVSLTPIPGDGEPWGYISLDDCHAEREWGAAESGALKILGEIIGAAIARVRNLTDLANARRIVENSTTVLFRLQGVVPMPITYISANVAGWGYEPAQFTNSPTFYNNLVHPDDQARVNDWRARVSAGDMSKSSLEIRFRVADGSYRWFDDRISIARDGSGQLSAIEGVLIDITARKDVEEKLTFSKILLGAAIENSPDGVLVVNHDGKILSVNARFLEMWNIPPDVAVVGADRVMLETIVPAIKDPEEFAKRVGYIYEHPEEKIHDEIELRDGRVFDRHSAPLVDSASHYLGRIWFFRDITERKNAERELAKLARTDALTGLANRATFLERLDLAFASVKRGAVPFAVLFLDLDRFKEINDTLGHHAGDVLLQLAAQRIACRIRDTDAGARFGGDEFAILQVDASEVSSAGALATEIRAVLAEPYEIEGSHVRITASVGIAAYNSEVADPAEILARADRALYLAKEEGKDRFRFYSDELDRVVHERMALSNELQAGIARNELELYYQPQIAIATGVIVGVEALVRWNHPTRGQLTPDLFLPTAEQTGAIVALGEWVLDRACGQYRLWLDQGVAPPVVAVNLSGAQLKLRRDFSLDVVAVLENGRFPRRIWSSKYRKPCSRHRRLRAPISSLSSGILALAWLSMTLEPITRPWGRYRHTE